MKHLWVTRFLFLEGRDPLQFDAIVEGKDGKYPDWDKLWTEFIAEVGGTPNTHWKWSKIGGRYQIDGPNGFSIIELENAYTEQEMIERGLIDSEVFNFEPWKDIFTMEEAK